MTDYKSSTTKSIELLLFSLLYTFALVLGFLLIFLQLDLLAVTTTR
jgi:hypothetical protein